MVEVTDVTDSTVHLSIRKALPPCNLHLGGGRLKRWDKGGKLSGFVAMWLGSWIDLFNLYRCPDAL